MTTVNFSFGPYFSYQNEFAELGGGSSDVTVALEDGTHTFTSGDVVIGDFPAFEYRRLMGHITFQYSYDEAGQTVTVSGTDYASADAMCLVTFPEGTAEYCRQWAAVGAGFPADDLMANPHWNYCTPCMPGMEEVLREMARAANDALIAALRNVPGLIVRIREDLPELSPEVYRQLLTVYRNGTFRGLYGQVGDLIAEDDVLSIESIYGGTADLGYNRDFANVIGSTRDPRPRGSSWLNLWTVTAGGGIPPRVCTSLDTRGFDCGSSLVGGHVILGQVAEEVPTGSNSVLILPICSGHNNRANDNLYMSTITYQTAVWLKNYLG
jgi:hypothetical protein